MAKKYIEGFSREKAKTVACDIPYSLFLKLKLKATQDGTTVSIAYYGPPPTKRIEMDG